MLLLEDKRYYTYIYLDPRKPGEYIYEGYKFDFEPIYIGKGKYDRYKVHLCQARTKSKNVRNKYFQRILIKILESNINPIYFKLDENLSNKEAMKFEINLIKLIGRKNTETGPLLNMTVGGDGTSGRICSKETKEKLREIFKGREVSQEIRDKVSKGLKGRQLTDYQRECIIKSNKTRKRILGNKRSKETKENISKALKGKKKNYKDFPESPYRLALEKKAKRYILYVNGKKVFDSLFYKNLLKWIENNNYGVTVTITKHKNELYKNFFLEVKKNEINFT